MQTRARNGDRTVRAFGERAVRLATDGTSLCKEAYATALHELRFTYSSVGYYGRGLGLSWVVSVR